MQPVRREPVVDVALPDRILAQPTWTSRNQALSRLRISDTAFFHLTRGSAITVLIILGGIIVSLIVGAAPALQKFGFSFLITERWNPVTEVFGALAPIYGTLMT